MGSHQRGLSALTIDLWLAHHWRECTAGGDRERQFVRGKARPPEDGTHARRAWFALQGIEEPVPTLAAPPERRIILTDPD